MSASSDSLGEQLFELVDVYNTGHSQKITGKSKLNLNLHLKLVTRLTSISYFGFRTLLCLLLICVPCF